MQYCDDPDNFFSNECRNYLSQVRDVEEKVNDLGAKWCPTALNEKDIEWCGCFLIPEPPAGLSDAARAVWPCMQASCNNTVKALQPFGKNCPNTVNICEQKDIATEVRNSSSIGNQMIQTLVAT
jgi:hypothetical protein